MQSVKIGKLLRQLAVLISRNFQLIWNQKLTLGSLILQAPLMVLSSSWWGSRTALPPT